MYARFLILLGNSSNLTAPIAFLGADASAHGISNPPRTAGVGNTDRRKSCQFDTRQRELMLLDFRISIWWVKSTQRRRKLLDGWILPAILWRWHTNRTPLRHTATSLQFTSSIGPQKMLYNSHTDPSINIHLKPSQSTWSLRSILDSFHPYFRPFPLLVAWGIHCQISLRRRPTLWLQLPTPQYRRHNSVLIWTRPSRPCLAGASVHRSWRMERNRSYFGLGIFPVRLDSCGGWYYFFLLHAT